MNSNISLAEIYKCENCGASLKFKPGTLQNICDACNTVYNISIPDIKIEYKDFEKFISSEYEKETSNEIQIIPCSNCGAEIQFDSHVVSGECSFCTTPLNITKTTSTRKMKPEGVIPFQITHVEGLKKYQSWFQSRWLAPNDLKKNAKNPDKLSGIYIPFWIFNANTYSKYEGYKIVKRNKSTSRYFKTGNLTQDFYHLDTVAAQSLPKKNVDLLEPWDWNQLIPYCDQIILGFKTESYTIDIKKGEEQAREKMREIIKKLVKKEIGGDRQEITSLNIFYKDIQFKYVLLPIWVSAFNYKNKTYRFVINGQSGEVQGERPYSIWKISFLLLYLITAIICMGYFWVNGPALLRTIFAAVGIISIIVVGIIAMKTFEIDSKAKTNPYFKK